MKENGFIACLFVSTKNREERGCTGVSSLQTLQQGLAGM